MCKEKNGDSVNAEIVALNGNQKIIIAQSALAHIVRHRQLQPKSSEAGGQLFGTVDIDAVTIEVATGPRIQDSRSRYSFRSDHAAAQREILARHHSGKLYLGEWHTHPEDVPQPSASDIDAMRAILAKSALNTNMLMLMIVGRNDIPSGITLLKIDKTRVTTLL